MDHQKQKILEEYWLKKLAGKLEKIRLPVFEELDKPLEPTSCQVAFSDSASLRKVSKDSDLALFILFLSGLSVVLERYTGIQDLIIGTLPPTDKTSRQEPLLLRNHIARDLRLSEVLGQTQKAVLEAFNYADYDFADLASKLQELHKQDLGDAFGVVCVYDRLQGKIKKPDRCELLIVLERAGDKLVLRGDYDPSLYDACTVERFLKNVTYVLESFPHNLDRRVAELEVICPEEKALLLSFNQTTTEYPRHKTIQELFEEQVAAHPDKLAILSDHIRLTYRELNERANRLARTLRAKGVQPEDLLILMAEPSPETVLGMLAIVKAGGCYVPVRPDYPEARKKLLMEDTGSSLILTTRRERETIPPALSSEVVVCIDDPDVYTDDASNPENHNRPNHLIYVMYTSGTTGKPKGVMIEHRNVIRLVKNTNYIRFEEHDRILQTCALEFDPSAFEVWGALLNGLTLCLAPKEQLLEPAHLRELIKRYDVTTLWLTTPLFAQLAQLDASIFSGLRYLLVGGDVVSPYHVNLVRNHAPELIIIDGYGPTENATFSTTFAIDREYRKRIPVGKPIANSTAYIVDESQNLQPIGVIGELYVGGEGIARGYLNDEALTNRRFFPFLTEQRVYKTGDLARWLPDGNIDFLGRIDDQVKIKGYRVEPGEIEVRLLRHPNVKEALVLTVVNEKGDKVLCAYLVCDRRDTRELKAYLLRELPEFMVPSYFVYLDEMPLNPHGKIDRKRLPAPSTSGDLGEGEPRDALDERMAAIWKEVLEIDHIGIYDDFFNIGGHSMKAIKLISLIHKEFGAKLGLQHLLKASTIADLVDVIRSIEHSSYVAIEKQPAKEFYELSVSQKRLAELYDLDPDNAAFNIPLRYTWREALDEGIVRRVLETLVERHEALRTYIKKVEERYVQIVESAGLVKLESHDLSHLSPEEIRTHRERIFAEEATVPFRLETAPLYRVKLIKCSADEFDILWTMHHIVSDGWSMNVLETEFTRLYRRYRDGLENNLEPVRLQFKDYVTWHNRLLGDQDRIQPVQAFWSNLLRQPLSMVKLPYDFDKVETGVGRRSSGYHAVIPEETTERLRKVAKDYKTSLFIVLFAGFNLLLHKLSGQNDIITGIPSANRYHEDLKNTVGFFVDSVITRTMIKENESLSDFVGRVNENILKILDHAYYPIELACSTANTTWSEILSTFFNMATFGDVNQKTVPDAGWYHIERVQNAKMELVFYLTEYKDGVEVEVNYYNELFKPSTIEDIIKKYVQILVQITDSCYEA